MKKSIKIILIVLMSILVLVGGVILLVQLLYPRFEHSYKEIDEIYVTNYVDGEYVRAKVSQDDMKRIYEIIKHSWIDIDFFSYIFLY